jgi:release factor glutamine methyltransferase
MKTVRELLKVSAQYLAEKGIAGPRLDAELLLAHALGMDRVKLYCSLEQPLHEKEISVFRELIRRRQSREPVAYLLGVKEFYGLEFQVSPAVLIPRPDTETLVECALDWLREHPKALVCDVGTGSGAIAVALAANAPLCKVAATDSSREAIDVAVQNADKHRVNDQVEFFHCEFFDDGEKPFDLIVSNPPYIPDADKETLEPEIIKYEPHQALFAGPTGLDAIESLIPKAQERLSPGGALMIEVGKGQGEIVSNQIANLGVFGNIEVIKDLAGIGRVVCATEFHGVNRG